MAKNEVAKFTTSFLIVSVLEIPPPTYEEALRAALVHSNNNRNETTSPNTINITNDNNSTSSS